MPIPEAPRVPIENNLPLFREPKGQSAGAFPADNNLPRSVPDANIAPLTNNPLISVGDLGDADKSLKENLTSAFTEALLNL